MGGALTGMAGMCTLFGFPERSDAVEELWNAINRRSYAKFYARLKTWSEPIQPENALWLCMQALEAGLTERAFRALLARCPPVEEFLHGTCDGMGFGQEQIGLMEKAAACDRADILDLLLSLGSSPNRYEHNTLSPLEMAVDEGALRSVERLLREPKLDCTLTPCLLESWSRIDSGNTMLDFCIQAIAPRVMGDVSPSLAIPIPDQLTPAHAARAANWGLLKRICRERGCTSREAKEALRCFPERADGADARARAEALDAIFSVCPTLLRGQRARQLLTAHVLYYRTQTEDVLTPWLDRIRDRGVSLHGMAGCESFQGVDRLLDTWAEVLPSGPFPTLDRRMELNRWDIDFLDGPSNQEIFARMIHTCPVAGKNGKPGRLSPLADALLDIGPAGLVEEQLRPGGLLTGEDPQVLLDCCGDRERPQDIRAALAAWVKREADYEL